jgi:zinc protease
LFTGTGARSGHVTLSLSSEDLDRALPIWRDVVIAPGFDGDRLTRAKGKRLKSLQAINNDPGDIAYHRWRWLVMGKDHPASHLETRAEIDAVTAEDLRRLHARFVRPENAIIGASGDLSKADVMARLDRLFGSWPKDPAWSLPELQVWTPHPEPGVYLLRGDYEQSQVCMGRIIRDLNDDSPDYPHVQILSYALGFGRVFYRVRNEGLSYGAGVMFNVGDQSSIFRGFGSGRGDATVPILEAMLEETQALRDRPFTREELESARVYQVGGEINSNATPAALVSTIVSDLMRGLHLCREYVEMVPL